MSNEPSEQQLAEATVNYFFGNGLTTEQHTIAVQITKEIDVEAESKALALEQWRERVSQFEQDFQTRLSQADTPQQLSSLRLASLWLQFMAAGAATNDFINELEARTHYERGIEYAEAFLAQGETEANVRGMVLILYYDAGGTLGKEPFNDAKKQLTYYQRGIDHNETFLTQGETNAAGREWVLKLYFNAGNTLGKEPFNDAKKELTYYQRGIDHAETFLNQGETNAMVRDMVLTLYSSAGFTLGKEPFNDAKKQLTYYQRGIDHAETFLTQGEINAAVREQVLRLYFDAGVTLGKEPFNDAKKQLTYYQRGIDHAETFLTQGETNAAVREWVLSLYFNAGNTLGDEPFNDAKKELTYYQRGIDHAETFLTQGETNAAVRELVLNLYFNAGGTLGDEPFNDAKKQLTYYQRGIDHAETFLTQGETNAAVRELVLSLYVNAGLTLGKEPFNDAKKQLTYYQRGIDHAETFLTQSETNAVVREPVLDLHLNYTAAYYNTGQIGQLIHLLPPFGLWSWVNADKLTQKNLEGWQNNLEISPNPAHFTAAFQSLLRTIVLNWHCPLRPHRHFGFIPTQTLLAISEGLYALEQAEENRHLQTVYRNLEHLNDLPFVDDAQTLQTQHQELQQALAKITALDNLSNWQKITQWFQKWQTTRQLRQLQQQQTRLSQNPLWQEQVAQTEQVLVNWLYALIKSQFNLHEQGLDELPAISLGILLASNSVQTAAEPEAILETWHHTQPWQDATTLQTALAATNWQTWAASTDEPLLADWIDSLDNEHPTVRRLRISQSHSYFAQPELQAELHALTTGNLQKLANRLDSAWQAAQKSASRLARLFMALSDFDFQSSLLTISKHDPDACHHAFQTALAMVILGDVPRQVKPAVQTWLKQQHHFNAGIPILDTFNTLKHRFTRAVSIYKPNRQLLEGTVHDWAKVSLTENLAQSSQTNPQILWHVLERIRVGLTSLTLHLPKDWAETLGTELWQALTYSIMQLVEGHKPTEQEMWPPLATWLQTLDKWLSKPPSIEQCQQALSPTEALVQPFFDPVHQRLRVLWLDQDGLRLQDELPDDCAPQHLWATETPTGIISQWISEIEVLKKTAKDSKVTETPDLKTVLKSTPVISFATTLQQWATNQQLNQLTVIFPAPLGQLPWETLPQLENILGREISIGHWYEHRTAQKNTPTEPKPPAWVSSDPSGAAQCMLKEAQWVSKHFEGKPDIQPHPSVFDALHNLANCHQAHLATHGAYNRYEPNASFLTLASDQDIHFPLWMTAAIRTEANVVLLSACESNLSGQDTEGLLTPVGIGPTLAAAGAKTVVGTLWPCDGLAALCFSYYFYTIAQKNPQKLWHHVAAEARHAVRDMRREELQTVIAEFDLKDENDLCWKKSVERHKAVSLFQPPFNRFDFWAGFTVLGQVERLN